MFSLLTCSKIEVLLNGFFDRFFFLTNAEIRTFIHGIIYIANKAQYLYLYTEAKSLYFCVTQQKKKTAQKELVKRTAILGHVNRLIVNRMDQFIIFRLREFTCKYKKKLNTQRRFT